MMGWGICHIATAPYADWIWTGPYGDGAIWLRGYGRLGKKVLPNGEVAETPKGTVRKIDRVGWYGCT